MGIGLKEDVFIGVFITIIINTVIFGLFRLKQRNDNYLNNKGNVRKYDSGDNDKYSGGYDMG